GKISGNTFYKNYSGTLSIELDKKLKIEDNFGFDWKDKILEITSIPDKVKSYFESQNL
ncbi:MAG: hypothetical protein IPO24_06615, partial [Bacteroidetes bacterium]|nr:hypothetical protein [Bacteroidota bacterium]